ncbi:C39 family peptidase [Pseudoxanthomonas daejeonensis]|uniref:C39 family peptidase n=1 Tax=Pseudoxanthomonas daejeonensis TaxID=266062 RepID=UPI001F5415DB|nr:C39 family peptidase [Pseudoxanthomonas daejeonensis]UNK59048.1 C39 family peptidase [Pseudoxanthomonas daejeonensis]
MLVLLCAVPAGQVRAADVAFTGVLPNGALYRAPVVSMREARFSNLVRQQTDYSCGAASLATILKYAYHLDADETTVIEGMLSLSDAEVVKERGFSLLDIKRYVESLGLRGRGYRVDEARLRSLRVPSLVLMDVNGFRHFVVLKQVNGDMVEVADPILGNRVLPLPEFLDAWPSRAVFVVIGSDFDRNTVLLQPSTKPSARALYARQGPITDAELLDFGFTHADLF